MTELKVVTVLVCRKIMANIMATSVNMKGVYGLPENNYLDTLLYVSAVVLWYLSGNIGIAKCYVLLCIRSAGFSQLRSPEREEILCEMYAITVNIYHIGWP